jgi:sugar phosphate isomerase/epimerase
MTNTKILPIALLIGLFTFGACSERDSNARSDDNDTQINTTGEQLLPDPGVVSFTFRNQFGEDIPGTLDFIKETGINNIEFSNLFGITAEEMRALLDERGLVCTSYGANYRALTENFDQVVHDAKTLGARHVRLAWFPHDAPFDLDDAQRAANYFNDVGRRLAEHGLMFSYHNHGYEFVDHEDGTLFDYIVQNTDPEYVNFQMDVFWVVWPGHDPAELLERYPDRFRLMHLKDMRKGATGDLTGRTPDRNAYMVPLGDGQVDFQAILEAAQNTSIEYFYIEDEIEDVMNSVPRGYRYITNLRH